MLLAQHNIRKILVANRGEIACRIFKTAHQMGIATVAIYHPAEKNARYVRLANQAFELPHGFLDVDAIIEIAQKSGADAIHPGYGFLSEKANFARACEQAGIIFIGPTAEAIACMGDKATAREIALKAGVPILPGHTLAGKVLLAESELLSLADKVGYPLMLKSSAGGGGKGMVVVSHSKQLYPEYLRLRQEAMRLFHNADLVLERYLPKARHIEVQVLGNYLKQNFAIGNRDCSMQRYNQKIIEEAPAPYLSETTQKQLYESAVVLANLIGYSNAGTVEFLYDPSSNDFYFLEMNTRLQVEHPVTEMTSGLDLVAEQIKIASGIMTSYSEVSCTGHAMEARICAELPDGSYRPATGKIVFYQEPPNSRCDSGIEKDSEILSQFDNMVAKCIVHGKDRLEAIQRLDQALAQYYIAGVAMNIPLLRQILSDPVFLKGEMYTRYLTEAFPYRPVPLPNAKVAAALLFYEEYLKNQQMFGENTNFTIGGG